jgi:demethylmenaquinone methyltransferase/2-methoxy-6-polyprenyl-1,4-benzoquinol methylase
MFGRIAGRYDLLNRVLSLGLDRRWRHRLAIRLEELGATTVLDVCTGTGDVALSFDPSLETVGSDFCLPMLACAKRKARERGRRLPLLAADALQLPVRADSMDAVTVAFGVRNFERLEQGLAEMVRVLRPRGRLIILEFSRPRGMFGPVTRWWVRNVPPRVGRWISGDPEAYSYLPDSVEAFPEGAALCAVLENVGLEEVVARPLTGGVATLYEGTAAQKGEAR